MATSTPQVIGGVDTHRDLHVVAAIDPVGRPLGHRSFPATPPVTARCWLGCRAWVGSSGSGWRALAPMALDCCDTCARQV
jgi:hypothetical protein